MTMTMTMTMTTAVARFAPELADEAHVAAAAFLARYSGRTLDAYRHDLRYFFQWADDVDLDILGATRPHIETYRCWLEERGLAASTIDRRLSTVCGFYRFAHIDGRIMSNPAQYVRRPQVPPSTARGMDRSELGVFLFTAERYDRPHAALAVLLGLNGLRVSEACTTNIEGLGLERGHRTLQILGKGSKPRSFRSSHAPPAPSISPSATAMKDRSCNGAMANVSTVAPPTVGCIPSANEQGSVPFAPTCSVPRSSWPPSTPGYRYATSKPPPATPIPEPPPSTTGADKTLTATPPTSSSPSSPAADRRAIPRRSGWPASGAGSPAAITGPYARGREPARQRRRAGSGIGRRCPVGHN
jgi:hypothetical protein